MGESPRSPEARFEAEVPREHTAEYSSNPEVRERQIELVQDVRDRHGILLVSSQPQAMLEQMGMEREDEYEWFRTGLGLPPDTDRLKLVSGPDDDLPETIPESGIIVGGSAHSVYENTQWMAKMKSFLREMARQGKPILGVCFGKQLIAETFGGKVEEGGEGPEIGLVDVNLTEEGERDPLFEGVPKSFQIYTYHGDTVVAPPDFPGTALLARSDMYAYQALALGSRIRTVQFHPEIGRPRIKSALKSRRGSLIDSRTFDEATFTQMIEDVKGTDFDPVRKRILRNFDRNFVVRFAIEES